MCGISSLMTLQPRLGVGVTDVIFYGSKTSTVSNVPSSGWITSQNDTAPKHVDDLAVLGRGWITSQNDTAPKPRGMHAMHTSGWITSQNDTAPKHMSRLGHAARVGLPVRTTLLQNKCGATVSVGNVGLPVRTTLLQNICRDLGTLHALDYQSERHCSKTNAVP